VSVQTGFLRLWIVVSALYVIGACLIFAGPISREFEQAAAYAQSEPGRELLPVPCKEARGREGADYTRGSDALCWYDMAVLRELDARYADMPEGALVTLLYRQAHLPEPAILRPAPWQVLSLALFWIAAGPLVLLAFGQSLGWATSRFLAHLEAGRRSLLQPNWRRGR
jgi:hypothetical protein